MSGEKILKGLREAVAIASGETLPARVHFINPIVWRCETTGNPVGTDTVMVGAPACMCRGCRGAALEAENAKLHEEANADLERRLTDRCRITELEAENARLRIALHDAIRRPLGVTPDSALEFYDQRMADEAEERRPRMGGGDAG